MFKDGDKKIDLEISAELRRYLANPRDGFKRLLDEIKKESR